MDNLFSVNTYIIFSYFYPEYSILLFLIRRSDLIFSLLHKSYSRDLIFERVDEEDILFS